MRAACSQAGGGRDPALQALGYPVHRLPQRSGSELASGGGGGAESVWSASVISTLRGSVFASVKAGSHAD